MLAVLITLTPGCRNEFIDSQKAKVRIAVLSIMDVRKHWSSTLELLEHAFRLYEFTREWLKNPKYGDYWPLFTTQDEWPIVVLATGPGNPPAVQVWTGKTVRFGSRTVQKLDPQHLGGPNPDQYPSTRGFCRVWLDPSVPISGSVFQVFLFMVAFRYPTVNRKILSFAHH